MIVGLGTDIVNIERIEKSCSKFGEHLTAKLFTPAEQADIKRASVSPRGKYFKTAKLFAAKEAVSKALGTGFSEGIGWQDIEIGHDEKGRPLATLNGKAAERASYLCDGGKWRLWLSLSDEYPLAQAVVIIEKI